MKKILIINGHPNASSFNFGLAESYLKGAIASGAEVETITIAALNFNPNLQFGYQKRTELEPDLLEAWKKIKRAEHLVWIHPVWWGAVCQPSQKDLLIVYFCPEWHFNTEKIQFGGINY